ncbi:hypothetical protein ABZ468_10830 [Streptomyces sp. NPDC005708]|uniref:hypothetical protein n=1 Tax=Streptomyces sp. NPDC005708 TaxID=3154564 RepID=UPI003406E847
MPTSCLLTDEGCAWAEHGRGLFLVDGLERAWIIWPSDWAKTVWRQRNIPDAGSGAADRRMT